MAIDASTPKSKLLTLFALLQPIIPTCDINLMFSDTLRAIPGFAYIPNVASVFFAPETAITPSTKQERIPLLKNV